MNTNTITAAPHALVAEARPRVPMSQRDTIFPTGVIEEFYNLGNHPVNIFEFFEKDLYAALRRIELGHQFDGVDYRLRDVVREFRRRSEEFVGHHVPTSTQRYLSLRFVEILADRQLCPLEGARHLRHADSLCDDRHNVLIVSNHTSVLDTYLTYTAYSRQIGHYLPLSFLMSQIFEYVPITALMTAGADKFMVFQPKHIDLMRQRSLGAAFAMRKQNAIMLRSLKEHCCRGRKMIMLYPERDRAAIMGPPEPRYLTMIKHLDPDEAHWSGRKLYVLPSNTCGHNPVISNARGPGEVDTLLDRLNIGHGNTSVGAPVELDSIMKVLKKTNVPKLLKATLGKIPTEEWVQANALGIAFLSMVAKLGAECDRGVYANKEAMALAERCFNEACTN